MVKSKRKLNKLLLVNNLQVKRGGRLFRSCITGRVTGFTYPPALLMDDLTHYLHHPGVYIESPQSRWEEARA